MGGDEPTCRAHPPFCAALDFSFPSSFLFSSSSGGAAVLCVCWSVEQEPTVSGSNVGCADVTLAPCKDGRGIGGVSGDGAVAQVNCSDFRLFSRAWVKSAARPAPLFFFFNPRQVLAHPPRLVYCKHLNVSLSHCSIHPPLGAPCSPTAHNKPYPFPNVHAEGRSPMQPANFLEQLLPRSCAADLVSPIHSSSWHFGEHDQDTGAHTHDAAGGSEVEKVFTFCT